MILALLVYVINFQYFLNFSEDDDRMHLVLMIVGGSMDGEIEP